MLEPRFNFTLSKRQYDIVFSALEIMEGLERQRMRLRLHASRQYRGELEDLKAHLETELVQQQE